MSRPRLQEFFAEETQESKSEVKGKTQKKKKKEMDCIKARMLLCHLITQKKKKNIKAVNLFFLEKKKFCVYIYIYDRTALERLTTLTIEKKRR